MKRQRRKRQSVGHAWYKGEAYPQVETTTTTGTEGTITPSAPPHLATVSTAAMTAGPTSDYSSQTLDEDNLDGQARRPSTSSETSQALPSDEKSSKPPSQTTKSEGEEDNEEEEDFGEEGDDERSEGGAPNPLTSEDPSATPTSLHIDTTPLGTPTVKSGVAPRSGHTSMSTGNSGRKARSTFRADMSRTAVSCWLRASGFGSLRSKFAKFTGADMLRLSRKDLVLMCGTAEGIRLSNALLQK